MVVAALARSHGQSFPQRLFVVFGVDFETGVRGHPDVGPVGRNQARRRSAQVCQHALGHGQGLDERSSGIGRRVAREQSFAGEVTRNVLVRARQHQFAQALCRGPRPRAGVAPFVGNGERAEQLGPHGGPRWPLARAGHSGIVPFGTAANARKRKSRYRRGWLGDFSGTPRAHNHLHCHLPAAPAAITNGGHHGNSRPGQGCNGTSHAPLTSCSSAAAGQMRHRAKPTSPRTPLPARRWPRWPQGKPRTSTAP